MVLAQHRVSSHFSRTGKNSSFAVVNASYVSNVSSYSCCACLMLSSISAIVSVGCLSLALSSNNLILRKLVFLSNHG